MEGYRGMRWNISNILMPFMGLMLISPLGCEETKIIEEASKPTIYVRIEIPSYQHEFTEGYPKKIIGKATVDERPIPSDALFWESSLDGEIGFGDYFSTEVLSIGDHIITLTAFDKDGNSDSESISIKKVERPERTEIKHEPSKKWKGTRTAESEASSCVDNGDGTITDRNTGRMWQQSITSSPLNWEDACRYCENLRYAGFNDWRIPEKFEYETLVNGEGSTISKVFNNYSVSQWSKTNCPRKRNFAVTVMFEYFIKHNGFIPQYRSAPKISQNHVRCVR